MVWNIWIIFPYIGNFIIQTEELHHFSEGLNPTTNQIMIQQWNLDDSVGFPIRQGHDFPTVAGYIGDIPCFFFHRRPRGTRVFRRWQVALSQDLSRPYPPTLPCTQTWQAGWMPDQWSFIAEKINYKLQMRSNERFSTSTSHDLSHGWKIAHVFPWLSHQIIGDFALFQWNTLYSLTIDWSNDTFKKNKKQ